MASTQPKNNTVCMAELTVISVHMPTATSASNLLPSSHSIAVVTASATDDGWLLGGFRLMHAISFSRWTCAFCTSCEIAREYETVATKTEEDRESLSPACAENARTVL